MSVLLPINDTAANVDFSNRPVVSTTVVASPALAAETIICTVTVPNNIQVLSGVKLNGWAAFTMGTSGVSCQLRIRRTNVTGTVAVNGGAVTGVAAALYSPTINGYDTGGVAGTVYNLTMQIASGAAASTVSAVFLEAFAY